MQLRLAAAVVQAIQHTARLWNALFTAAVQSASRGCRGGWGANLLGGHAAAEDGGGGQVAAVAGVRRAHHVLGVPHLLRELGHAERAVLLAAAACQRREADHEEVQAREGDQVHRQLAQVGVQLACARSSHALSAPCESWQDCCLLSAHPEPAQLAGNPYRDGPGLKQLPLWCCPQALQQLQRAISTALACGTDNPGDCIPAWTSH